MKEEKELNVPTKFNPATQKYEADMEKLNEKVEELNKGGERKKENSENKKPEGQVKQEDIIPEKENKKSKKGEGSFKPVIIIMIISILIASLWDRVPQIKNAVGTVLNPTAGALLNWNLNWGFLIIVFVITIIITLAQKYATDQKTLKELKKEQKEIQKQMKEFKHHPEKMMELQKKQWKLMPKQMKLSMRALAFTGVPFILFFRWFHDYFDALGDYKLWLGMSWFVFYLLFAIIIGSIIRKQMDVV